MTLVSEPDSVALRRSDSEPAEPLKAFCEALLDLVRVKSAESLELHTILPGLSEAIGRGCGESIEHLRRELKALDDAAGQLKSLGQSPLVQLGNEATVVLEQLDHSRTRILRVIGSLTVLSSTAGSSSTTIGCLEATSSTPRTVSSLNSVSRLNGVDPCAEDSALLLQSSDHILQVESKASGVNTRDTVDVTSTASSDSASQVVDRVASLFQEAERHRRDRKFEQAEALYAEVLTLRSDYVPAWLYRGRVRLLRGQPDLAVDDFSRVIRLDKRESAAYCWRADAHAIRGRYPQAIHDYGRALELRPDFPVARYNRAVACRESGRFAESLADLDQLIELQPNHGPLHLNRGLIFQAQGDFAGALNEFNKAVRLQPTSSEALRCQRAARLLLEESQPRVTDHELQTGVLAPQILEKDAEQPSSQWKVPVKASFNLPSLPLVDSMSALDGIGISGKITVSDASSATRTETPCVDADNARLPEVAGQTRELDLESFERHEDKPVLPRDSSDSLAVQCPGCDRETSIRWNKLQLGRVLACPHCSRNFTLTPGGELGEVVRDRTGKWVLSSVVAERRREVQMRRLQFVGGTAAVLLVGAMLFFGSRIGQSYVALETKLPTELEARTELFARAWLSGDSRTLRRLTDPAFDRQLFTWYRRNAPPIVKNSADSLKKDVRVEVTKLPSQPPFTYLQVHLDGLLVDSEQPSAELQLAWEDRSGNWVFHPELQH